MRIILAISILLITSFGGQLLSQPTNNMPHSESDWFALGKKNQKQNLLQDAIKCYTEVLSLNPNNDKAYFNRGTTYESLGLFRKAIADFEREIQINTNDAEAYEKLGDLNDEIGETGQSLAFYSNAIMIQPTENRLLNRSIGYVKIGYYKEALMDLNQVLRINPDNHAAFATKGTIYFELDQMSDAFRMFKTALSYEPNNPYYISNLGKLYYKTGTPEHAITFFQKAIDILPDESFYMEKAFCHLKTGNIEQAHADAATALFQNTQSHEIQYVTGLIFLEEGKTEEAIEFFTFAINSNNSIPEYYLKRADARYKHGDYAGAMEDAKMAEAFDKIHLEEEVNDLLGLVNEKASTTLYHESTSSSISSKSLTTQENESFDENDFE